jgi:hypothetical protein
VALTTPLFCCRMPVRRSHWEAFATSKSWHDSTVPLHIYAVVQLCSGTVESDDRIWPSGVLTHILLYNLRSSSDVCMRRRCRSAQSRRCHAAVTVTPQSCRTAAAVTLQSRRSARSARRTGPGSRSPLLPGPVRRRRSLRPLLLLTCSCRPPCREPVRRSPSSHHRDGRANSGGIGARRPAHGRAPPSPPSA